jgi:alpha-N-arabinofuranosidase
MNKKLLLSALMAVSALSMSAQAKLTLNVGDAKKTVSPTLYGLMTEEINYSYEGGLYAQLLRNPSFCETTQPRQAFHPLPTQPKFWELSDTVNASMHIVFGTRLALADSPRQSKTEANSLSVITRSPGLSIINRGFWGIPRPPEYRFHRFALCQGQFAHHRVARIHRRQDGVCKNRHRQSFSRLEQVPIHILNR